MQEPPFLRVPDAAGCEQAAEHHFGGVQLIHVLEEKKVVPDYWYQVRKKVGDIKQTLPQGIVGPFFNDEFGDTYGIIYAFTADGFTHRELRDYAEEARSRLLRVKDVSKAEFLGTQDERIYVEFSTHRLAELGMDRMELVQALVSQNAVVPSGTIRAATREAGASWVSTAACCSLPCVTPK